MLKRGNALGLGVTADRAGVGLNTLRLASRRRDLLYPGVCLLANAITTTACDPVVRVVDRPLSRGYRLVRVFKHGDLLRLGLAANGTDMRQNAGCLLGGCRRDRAGIPGVIAQGDLLGLGIGAGGTGQLHRTLALTSCCKHNLLLPIVSVHVGAFAAKALVPMLSIVMLPRVDINVHVAQRGGLHRLGVTAVQAGQQFFTGRALGRRLGDDTVVPLVRGVLPFQAIHALVLLLVLVYARPLTVVVRCLAAVLAVTSIANCLCRTGGLSTGMLLASVRCVTAIAQTLVVMVVDVGGIRRCEIVTQLGAVAERLVSLVTACAALIIQCCLRAVCLGLQIFGLSDLLVVNVIGKRTVGLSASVTHRLCGAGRLTTRMRVATVGHGTAVTQALVVVLGIVGGVSLGEIVTTCRAERKGFARCLTAHAALVIYGRVLAIRSTDQEGVVYDFLIIVRQRRADRKRVGICQTTSRAAKVVAGCVLAISRTCQIFVGHDLRIKLVSQRRTDRERVGVCQTAIRAAIIVGSGVVAIRGTCQIGFRRDFGVKGVRLALSVAASRADLLMLARFSVRSPVTVIMRLALYAVANGALTFVLLRALVNPTAVFTHIGVIHGVEQIAACGIGFTIRAIDTRRMTLLFTGRGLGVLVVSIGVGASDGQRCRRRGRAGNGGTGGILQSSHCTTDLGLFECRSIQHPEGYRQNGTVHIIGSGHTVHTEESKYSKSGSRVERSHHGIDMNGTTHGHQHVRIVNHFNTAGLQVGGTGKRDRDRYGFSATGTGLINADISRCRRVGKGRKSRQSKHKHYDNTCE